MSAWTQGWTAPSDGRGDLGSAAADGADPGSTVPGAWAHRVLIVEDEAILALAIEEALERRGWQVCGAAADGADALRLAERARPAFAVVDISLGQSKAGLEVGSRLARGGVAVLYASAYGAGFRQQMEDSGGRACLHKPFAAEDVPLALDALEALSRGEAPLLMPPSFRLFVD